MAETSRFQKANQISKRRAEAIECLAIFQTGSSLRSDDFSSWSDVDLLAVYREVPEQRWKHEYKHSIQLSLLQESDREFLRNLERGVPFELTAVQHGRVLTGEEWVSDLRRQTYEPKPLTFKYKMQSALNHFIDLVRVPKTLKACYHAAYHSYRELSRYVILHKVGRFVEGDANIRHELEAITPELAESFWDLREKRLDPPRSKPILELDTLREALHHELKGITSLGREVFHIEGLTFAGLARLESLLKRRGCTLASISFANVLKSEQYVTLTGRSKDTNEQKMFFFDMGTGDLKEEALELPS